MELHREEIEAAGLRVVCVGLGEPKHARHFGGKLAPSTECVTNEEPALHAAFGIERGNLLRMVAPDALAAGPAAARLGGAVLLIDGSRPTTDTATRTLITDLGQPDLHLAGGTGAISTGAETSLRTHLGAAGTVTRYAGANRYDTARDMNGRVFGPLGTDFAFLATGAGFADALAGGPLAAAFDGPLYLSSPVCLRDDEYIDIIWLLTKEVYGLGGPGALSDRVLFGQNC